MKKYWYLLVLPVVLTVILMGCGPPRQEVSAFVESYVRAQVLTRHVDGYWVPVARVIDVQAGVVCYVGDDWGDCFLLEETKLDY